MKGKELKNNETTIELLDGKHKIALDFNTFNILEEMYGDVATAINKISGTVKSIDIKKFLFAAINSVIEDENKKYTLLEVGKLLEIGKVQLYVDCLYELLTKSMPAPKKINTDTEDEEVKN